jgi:hypothetical protein
MCPPKLKEMFTTTFTNGINNSSYRIQLLDWQRTFLEMESNTILCPHCHSVNIWDGKQSKPFCFHCQKEISFLLYLSVNHNFSGETNIIIAPEAELKRHHLNIVKFDEHSSETIGKMEQHPKNPNACILRNNTDKPWKYKGEDGTEYTVEPGQARALLPNCVIVINGVTMIVKAR